MAIISKQITYNIKLNENEFHVLSFVFANHINKISSCD